MLPSAGVGPLNALIATSVVMNALVTGVLQVYSFLPKAEELKAKEEPAPKEEPVTKEEPMPDHSSTGTGSAISSPT
jgi:hypothetical protein